MGWPFGTRCVRMHGRGSVLSAEQRETGHGEDRQRLSVRQGPLQCGGQAGVRRALIASRTLDGTNWLKPRSQIYCDSVQPWRKLGGEMQSFAKMPG